MFMDCFDSMLIGWFEIYVSIKGVGCVDVIVFVIIIVCNDNVGQVEVFCCCWGMWMKCIDVCFGMFWIVVMVEGCVLLVCGFVKVVWMLFCD